MSEYQYYEFQTIDKHLSAKQMAELRACSTRARITPTLFVNEYNWGNFKGDKDLWMERYFDAFLYFANWGTREIKLGLPLESLSIAEVDPYAGYDAFSICETNDKVILSFVLRGEDGYHDEDADTETLSSILPGRTALQRGDHRSLYLGWLLAVQSDELDPDACEPPVPPGLGDLDASHKAFASFLGIGEDLIEVAAEASAPMSPVLAPNERDLLDWLAKLSTGEKDKWLARLCTEQGASIAAEVLRRFRNDQGTKTKRPSMTRRRTADELLRAAEARADERERLAQQKAAAQAERLRQRAEAERFTYLETLVGQEHRLWAEIEKLASLKQSKHYDTAARLIQDLRDLANSKGNGGFNARLDAFCAAHVKKTALLARISKANL